MKISAKISDELAERSNSEKFAAGLGVGLIESEPRLLRVCESVSLYQLKLKNREIKVKSKLGVPQSLKVSGSALFN